MLKPERSFVVDELTVEIYHDLLLMGWVDAERVTEKMRQFPAGQDVINVTFAAAPSQNEFLETLVNARDNEWQWVRTFYLDEYLDLASDAPQRFAVFLDEHIFGKVDFREVHCLSGNTDSREQEAKRYACFLQQYSLDIAFIGIIENSHTTFNDTQLADFEGPYLVKIVTLNGRHGIQQVNDGCFSSID